MRYEEADNASAPSYRGCVDKDADNGDGDSVNKGYHEKLSGYQKMNFKQNENLRLE